MSRAKLNMGMVSERKRMFVAAAVAVFMAISAVAILGMMNTEAASPHTIFGYVTYEDGTPVAGALVNITVVNATNTSDIRGYLENVTDSTGFFSIQLGNLPNEWSDGDIIYGYAVYDGFGGHNDTTIDATLPAQWFNITINEPRTTKHIGEPSCETGYYVTSHTPFSFTAEPAPNSTLVVNATYYRIWYNGTWSDWTVYASPFYLTQGDGLYYIEFYSDDNESHEEVVHNQSHWVDDTAPPYTEPVFGTPNSIINGFPAINCETPLWINVSDNENGSGVTWINISIWRNANQPGPYNKIFEINITDNSTYDLNPERGVISVDVNQFIDEECYHEIIWKFGDCVGNVNGPFDIDISVDCSKPIISKEIGKPQQPGIYGNATWITSRTPIWFNVTDVGCGGGAGVWKFGYTVRWKENASNGSEPWNETRYAPVVVVDNGPLDLDNTTGVIRYIAYLEDDCVHEIHYWAVDYVGNNNTTKQKHWVDNTPPYIRKDIEKVVMIEQTEINNASFVNFSHNENETEDWQSFNATWSYIDAVSVYICGYVDNAYPPTIQIWNHNRSQMLAETEPLNISEYNETGNFYCGWIQLHLPERLYVEHGETYWLHISYGSVVPLVWNASTNNPYAGGYAIVNNETNMSWDFAFKIEYYPIVIRNEVGETIFFEGFEDDWVNDSDGDMAPPGWEVIVNNTVFHWLQYNNSSYSGIVYGGNYSAGVWWNYTNQSEWLISPEIDLPNYAILTFWSIYIRPEFANPDVHNYVLISTDNGTTWTVLADLMHEQKYEAGGNVFGEEYFNWYEEPVEISLYNYGGEKVRLAWHYEVVNTPGLAEGTWGIWMIDNVTIQTVNVSFVYDPDTLYTYYNDTMSYDGLDETWVTSEAIFDLSSEDEGCMGGVGFQSLMYRIYVDATNTWHPVDENDSYCGNYNITDINGTYWYVALNDTVSHTKIQFHEECEHILQIRAEDKLGNVRIINQTHYVDNSPPLLHVEYPDVHGFYYDEQEGKQYVRAGKTFYLNLTDEPECAVGWKNFTFYWRYEYTNFTTPSIEYHPVDENDHEYPGDVVFIDGYYWWKVVPGEPSVALNFDRECMHTIYYFYDATDWLDNEINTSNDISKEVVYVDENTPEMEKEHPPCYTEEPVIYLHPINWPEQASPWHMPEWDEWVSYFNWTQLYPTDEFGREYEGTYHGRFGYYYDMNNNGIADDGDYIELVDSEYGVHRLYLIENLTVTLEIYNETLNETKYVEFVSLWDGSWPTDSDFSQIGEQTGTLWMEVYPEFGKIYNVTSWFITDITLNDTATGEEIKWTIENATWDLILKPVPFIQKCSRINLTAWDTPEILKLVDQFQNSGDRADELQLEENILQWPWDGQAFQVSENVSAINEIWLWLDWDGPANVTVYLHSDGPFTPGTELGKSTVSLTGSSTGEWVEFTFDPAVEVTPGTTYVFDAFRNNGSMVHWFHADEDVYANGYPFISSEQSTGDWMFAIVAYRPNPCASGIEGIYYGYEFNGTFHPNSMTDNVSTYGQVINISQYYSDEEIRTNFSGHYLWYVYDDAIGIHFHEECIHWLYYWAKDNVCHHTPVHMQVYHVDEYNPVVEKEHPRHGYYTPVEVYVNEPFDNDSYSGGWLEGEFYVNATWWDDAWDDNGWVPYPSGQYVTKIQNITFTITNNDLNHDLHLTLHVEEIEGDEGISLEAGSDVNEKTYEIDVPAGSSLNYVVSVYDNVEFLREGVWHWWAEVENVTQYLRMGARINLSAYDPGYCAAGVENIYYRYEWNGSTYPVEGHPAAVNGSEIEPGVPEIANYWWYVYDNATGIVFNEECRHDLYYFAKDRACHNSTVHHQIYYVDGSAPVVEEELPEHGAIGNATVSLEENFYVPMDNGWAIVNGSSSYWDLKSNEPFNYSIRHDTYADYSGEYYAMAWRDNGGTADAWLITPLVHIPEDGNLTFYYATYYSSNEAAFEVCVNNVSTQTDTSAFVSVWDSGTFGDVTYRRVEIDLHQYAGQDVYIGFHCYYLESYYPYGGLTIDDVWIGGIHRIDKLLDDDVENGMDGWTIDDLTVNGSYWGTVMRLPVNAPPDPEWNMSMPNKPALWCGDLTMGNANNGGGRYGYNWNDTLTIKQPLNLSNVTGPINLTFWMWYYSGTDDYLYVEVSNDSENWSILKDMAGNDAIYAGSAGWNEYVLNMTPYIGNDTVWIRFRFVSDDTFSMEYNGFFIDNLTIYHNDSVEFFNDTFDDLSKWNAVMLETSRWHIVDSDYHSTNHSWWNGDDDSGNYLNFMDDVLISPVLDLSGYSYEYITLTFWHKRNFYSYYDYGMVEYRYSNDGTTWTTWNSLATYHYDRDWVQEFLTLNIHPQKIQYRFHFISDSTGTDSGWFVDDIRVELRNITTTVFEDDFERYTGILPLQGDVSHDFGWTVEGNFENYYNYRYGWSHHQMPEYSLAAIHAGWSYDQDEWLISPVIHNLPKFSNLTFMHRFDRNDINVNAYVYIKVDNGTWQWLATLSPTGGFTTEDISLWPYYGHDIQIAFRFVSPQVSYSSTYHIYNFWAIEWVNISSFGFLRAGAVIHLNATDLPDSECKVGVSNIYYRYEWEGTSYPEGYEPYHGTNWVWGWEIPGISNETDPEIGPYAWYIYHDSWGIKFNDECVHDLYYFAKDYVCHSSELHHERWYVDGTAPETYLGISWGDHPWIPRNGEELPANHWYTPGDRNFPDVICINDDVHLYANHYGTEPCIYPYNWQNNTYYRWTWWNPETEELEYYPNESTPGAVWGGDITVSSHADEIDEYWWMPYTGPFYFTEACNHTLYYFSKDDLCNTEEPNEWYVGVDDAAPETEMEFDIPDGTCLWYDEINDTYYFQDGTWVGINATDMPNNTYCRTGVWKIEYTVWKWNSTQAEVTVISDDITYYATLYIHGSDVGEIWDYIDVDNDSKWSIGDYVYINWNTGMGYNDGWYRITGKIFNGMFVLTVEDIFSGAGDWDVLIPWTTVYPGSPYDDYGGNVYLDWGYNYSWATLWLDVGGLNHYLHPYDDNNCGKYEIHWRVYDYNNMTIGERKQDVDIDCTPPRTSKEFGEPVIEQQISGGETIHWVNPATTKIWLNGTDDFLWDSGVAETWYKFWEEEPILLWKLNNATYNKHWFTIDEAVQALGYEDAADYFAHSPNVVDAQGKIELYHWSKDRVCHVEDWNESKQHIYVDGLPPVSRVADIEPYQQEEVPFNITVVDIMDYGFEDVGPIGVCKVEVYYAYSENNVTYGDWQLYATYNVPWDERNDVPNWTFSFTAPDGSGWYRFKSIAYDCLGNVEQPPFYHGDYDAECYVLGDTEPPVVTKEYGQPSIEIDLGEEMGHAITSDTPIYINATDMPEDDYTGIDKIYWSFDGITWYETASYGGAHEAHHSFTPSAFGLEEETLYHIFFKATDMLGHESSLGKQKFIIDDTPPATTITIGDNATMPFDITVNATDNVAGVETITLYFRYSSDGTTWSEWMEYGSATGNYTWAFIYNPDDGYYKPGYYQFYAYAEDKLGNAKAMPDGDVAEASCYVPPIPEDINGDGRVNVMDLYQIITHWGETGSPGWIPEDLNNDGVIDADDIYALILKWTG